MGRAPVQKRGLETRGVGVQAGCDRGGVLDRRRRESKKRRRKRRLVRAIRAARAPGAPTTHRDPALFFVGDTLHLHFRVGDEEDASPHAAASRDGGETWSGVSSLRLETRARRRRRSA